MKLNEQTVPEFVKRMNELTELWPGEMDVWLKEIGVEPTEIEGIPGAHPKATLVLVADQFMLETYLPYVKMGGPLSNALIGVLDTGFIIGYLFGVDRGNDEQ